jgi:hypothetical protein
MFNLLEGLIVIRGKKGLRRRRCRASMLLVGCGGKRKHQIAAKGQANAQTEESD